MKPLLNVFFVNYIEPYAKTLLDMESSGLAFLLNNEKFEDLNILYFLFSCNEKAFDLLKKTISDFIINFCEQKQNESKNYKESEKKIASEKFDKGHRRDFGQVMANGGLGAVVALLSSLLVSPIWLLLFVGIMATVTADT